MNRKDEKKKVSNDKEKKVKEKVSAFYKKYKSALSKLAYE